MRLIWITKELDHYGGKFGGSIKQAFTEVEHYRFSKNN